MKVKEIMRKAKTISRDKSVMDAAILMDKSSIGSLIVTDEKGKVIGMMTERDVLQKVTAKNKLPAKVLVEEIMTSPVMTIGPNAFLDDAVYLMMKHKIKRIPVVEENELMGIITSTEVLANSCEVDQAYLFD